MAKNLAAETRPVLLKDFLGDENLKKLFQFIIENNDFRSFIFYGKPGTGKTTISYILANQLNVSFDYFNAAIDKKEDLIKKIELNKILIIDEIHRLNKDKQDILLPYLENDLITIYATTTENPYFKLNPALRSRCHIIEIQQPSPEIIVQRLKQINQECNHNLNLTNEIYEFIALQSGGDFRNAINKYELIYFLFKNKDYVELDGVKKIIPQINFSSDKNQDAHYDYLSAFHKSLRGSDPDAALYYGLLILKTGDYDGLFRRMLCASYEDVGLANPKLGNEVLNAINAFERLGLPEGRLPIGFAILNIALSPKSNSVYTSINKVEKYLNEGHIYEIPNHLKDAHYQSASKLKRGIDYKYPHDFSKHYVKQNYLPKQLLAQKFYLKNKIGWEEKINKYWNDIKGEKDEI
ncbi:replication-associated recombination protein A [[Mycoplasma] anseris]|uniref:Replication-associated recombination protein A n=1 Tax=[Mycoplasma] anseris TaxID=92400 RepID=A0A2Z4NDU8_9BACT|nr:replication-associated recombination protein A [[Mycoplasma] anseris]AWX69676.1 replication-associated recombination protein A [[Mycoplasma] anseris]